uniref:Coenzyme Q-binding protein COQ10 START domain-containing protein n=1 Tax=Minutocellus polymorphus TaxID=265543 RepID=A0A6U4DG12_9STRA|mmetsp:Transcript_14008/g.23328  ORF Transcript_14008/g.23328 Transcript_14008/m.23328 type:complete len:368 (+) Transcript_14008:119-1222(+)
MKPLSRGRGFAAGTTDSGPLLPPVARLMLSLLLLLVILPDASLILASDPSVPHAHKGKQDPFSPGDPNVSLDSKALSILSSGQPFQTTIHVPGSTSGRGLVVQEVHAPPDAVWDRILDFNHYADMVPRTFECKNYDEQKHKATKRDPLEQTIYTKFKVGLPLIPKMSFYVKHLYYPTLSSLTWTLDYSKKSDFDDSVGYWYVVPHPDRLGWSRVYYSIAVSMFDWVPKTVVNFMSTKALTDATGWVKKFSEEKWKSDPRRTAIEALGEGNGGRANNSKSGRRGLFSRIGGKNKDSARSNVDADGSPSLLDDTCDSFIGTYTPQSVDVNKPSKLLTVKATCIRIGLIMTVSSLLVYNISLCLDRYAQN